ncbi:hypothetical protein ACIBIZ_44685 [Nonomuraea spiralis]|uniref:DUF1579 domain-containing protein n=1 Tax=Nonomuraea spiralis TaxID=46182 RepID=A0ABV5IE79_9ACTN|nr:MULTISPECIES: hypothetical protein [Nonomuraea]RSN04286.1 hypothetical protein DMB42_31965 [Nonomuraea sp. WAC 01424]GGS68109.1 hypothetical protein GCM10010176_008110 [Nonomuraea spiralis]
MTDKSPNPALRQLDVLIGTWRVSNVEDGEATDAGTVRFAWLEGGNFLVQHVDLADTKAVEYIGYDEESKTLKSHLFGQSAEILKYTWEVDGDTLTIWYGDQGSPARFVGTFNEDRSTNSGAWEWPGGGYQSTMTRV